MEYIISEEQNGILLKYFLRKSIGISGGLLKRLKKDENSVLVNGRHENVKYVLRTGDMVELNIKDTDIDVNEKIAPSDIPIDIIYEDENITVVNKPHNMPTHPSAKHYGDSLANALAYRYIGRPYVFRAVNRLDKDTSGIVLTANNRYYSAVLSQMIKNNSIKKEYIAVVCGRLEGEGTIEAPIARVDKSIIKREVNENGNYALTHYRSICSCDEISVISAIPVTGRTHQLRVHFAYIGHSVVGDQLYGNSSDKISRQALHAIKMSIDGIGEFSTPLPDDIKKLISQHFAGIKNIF